MAYYGLTSPLVGRQDQIYLLDGIQACSGLLWTYLPAWDDLLLWQDKPVGAGVTQFGGKCKPECLEFGFRFS